MIIAVILASSVGLGFVNEYRAEKASEALHSGIHHCALVVRDGQPRQVDVVELVPGDIVHLTLGSVVPADLRLLTTTELECDESVLTGESLPAEKSTAPVASGAALADRSCLAWMGTVVHAGAGRRRRRRHRSRQRVRPDRRGPGRPPARDRLPGRAAQVLHAAAAGRRWC